MEREQIIKALGCCAASQNLCEECPIDRAKKDDCMCGQFLAQNALALIKELTEENERLHASCTELTQCYTKVETLYKIECKRVDTVKADTVRKMQEGLKANKICRDGLSFKVVDFDTIDQIAKEMLEGK